MLLLCTLKPMDVRVRFSCVIEILGLFSGDGPSHVNIAGRSLCTVHVRVYVSPTVGVSSGAVTSIVCLISARKLHNSGNAR